MRPSFQGLLDEIKTGKVFCSICDNEATNFLPSSGVTFCGSCAQAFEWGQTNAEESLEAISELEEKPVESPEVSTCSPKG